MSETSTVFPEQPVWESDGTHRIPFLTYTSDELYKGIIAEKGTGVFNGKVYVKQDAQRTRAYQSNANILQGDDARIFTKAFDDLTVEIVQFDLAHPSGAQVD